MIDYALNENPLLEIYKHTSQPNNRELAVDNFKNIEYKHIKNKKLNAYCKNIIDIMFSNIIELKKHQYVFVKSQSLKIGDMTSGHGYWHLDSSLNPIDSYENYIFCSGINNTTEFFKTPIKIKHSKNVIEFDKQINSIFDSNRDSQILKPLTIYKYNGSNVHRGRKVIIPENRLLIRLSNTDKKLTVYN
jgi:hypothetical protein